MFSLPFFYHIHRSTVKQKVIYSPKRNSHKYFQRQQGYKSVKDFFLFSPSFSLIKDLNTSTLSTLFHVSFVSVTPLLTDRETLRVIQGYSLSCREDRHSLLISCLWSFIPPVATLPRRDPFVFGGCDQGVSPLCPYLIDPRVPYLVNRPELRVSILAPFWSIQETGSKKSRRCTLIINIDKVTKTPYYFTLLFLTVRVSHHSRVLFSRRLSQLQLFLVLRFRLFLQKTGLVETTTIPSYWIS